MSDFTNTVEKLDKLIDKLQANTGAENTTTEAKKQTQQKQQVTKTTEEQLPETKTQEKTQQAPAPKVQQSKEKKQDQAPKQKKEKAPKEKKKQEPKKQQGPKQGPELFSMIDMRIGEIVQCWKHPESQNLYCEKISFCGEVREIASGLQKFVPHEQMKGLVVVMANLKPRPLAGFQSNGMVVCASTLDHTAVEIIRPEGQVGERIYLQGFEQLFKTDKILPVLNPKKKILQKCLEDFNTDDEGFVNWKGIKVRTKAGFLRAKITKGNVS